MEEKRWICLDDEPDTLGWYCHDYEQEGVRVYRGVLYSNNEDLEAELRRLRKDIRPARRLLERLEARLAGFKSVWSNYEAGLEALRASGAEGVRVADILMEAAREYEGIVRQTQMQETEDDSLQLPWEHEGPIDT